MVKNTSIKLVLNTFNNPFLPEMMRIKYHMNINTLVFVGVSYTNPKPDVFINENDQAKTTKIIKEIFFI